MQYHQLLYLVRAAECGSFRKAARILGISQPSLSAAIISLEKELKVQLLTRTNKGIVVTPEGQRFVTLAQDIVNKTTMLQNLYSGSDGSHIIHTLNIATNPSQITLRTLREMRQSVPMRDIRVSVRNLSVLGCAYSVRSQESEVGVVFITSGQYKRYMAAFEENHLEYHRVSTKRCCVNLSRHNPLYNRDMVKYEELLAFPLARFIEDELSLLDNVVCNIGIGQQDFRQVYYFDSDSSIISFVKQTDAVKFGFPWCKEDYEAIGVRCIDFAGNTQPLELGWIRQKNRALSEGAQYFVQTLTRLFGDEEK
ncbi:LysR family transcriptional regulator [Angelakisella massiliensis]|uniref:LysR family transcriptional regulator n=1 Tax=Angelakisella massiliensis TaxID=1871018 RepID=UPI0008F974A4|nr:LysR family transcriptional regulator [Angelakisella massiliensis]